MENQKVKEKSKLDKKHIQGFLAGFNPGFFSGTVTNNPYETVCDVSKGDVTFYMNGKKPYVSIMIIPN